jgi:nucleoside-diphosphate-sugar epimerase
MAMDTFLITGVSGFVGSSLAMQLLKDNHRVIGIARRADFRNQEQLSESKYFSFIQGEISEDLLKKLDDVNIKGVYHLASQQPGSPSLQYADFYKGNVSTTLDLLNYFKHKPIEFFCYTSTISVFGKNKKRIINEAEIPEPVNNYGLTKYISEKILEIGSVNFPGKVLVVRLQSVFGKNDGYGIVNTFHKQFKNNENVELFSNGEIYRNLILLEDAVDILARVINNYQSLDKYEIFQAASSNSLRTSEIASIIKKYLNSKSEIVPLNKKYIFDWDIYVDVSKARERLRFEPMSLESAILYCIKQYENEL